MFTLLHFSPTGNAAYVAGLIADHLGDLAVADLPMETAEPAMLPAADHLVVVFPIHGFNAPRSVEHFVCALPAGRFGRVSLVAVGCAEHWVNEAASLRLRRICADAGAEVRVDALVPMPLTLAMAFPDDMATSLVRGAEGRARAIADALVADETTHRQVPWRSRLLSLVGRIESPAARLFGLELRASDACTSCGTCWRGCPASNITRGADGRPRFGFACTMCLRCAYACPERAIAPRFSKFVVIGDGYALSKYLPETTEPAAD